jgi:hypothetical protein
LPTTTHTCCRLCWWKTNNRPTGKLSSSAQCYLLRYDKL